MEDLSTHADGNLYRMDRNRILSVFPAEVWKIILKQFKNPEHLNNCSDSSPYFRELLKNQRVEFLFPGVIDILIVRNEKRAYEVIKVVCPTGDPNREEGMEFEYDDFEDSDDGRDIDINYTDMDEEDWINSVLNCRRVCSAWNKAIEDYYQQRKMTGIPEYVREYDPTLALKAEPWFQTKLSGMGGYWRTLAGFLDRFEQSHWIGSADASPKNPFLSRYLCLKLRPDGNEDEQDQAKMDVGKFLEYFGKDIWYFEFDFGVLLENSDNFYLRLKSWLELMPNLKYVNLSAFGSYINVSKDVIEKNPLPRLENLDVLYFYIYGNLVDELIRQNCHISSLILSRHDDFMNVALEQVVNETVAKSLTNLKILSGAIFDAVEGIKESKKLLEPFGQVTLETVTSEKPHVDTSVLFKIIENNWAETLTTLYLELGSCFDTNISVTELKDLRLNLPRIQQLHLRVRRPRICFLDIALPLKNSLEHLVVHMVGAVSMPLKNMEKLTNEQIVEFIGYEEKMDSSNVWKIFGKLKTLRMDGFEPNDTYGHRTFRMYTRAGKKSVYQKVDD